MKTRIERVSRWLSVAAVAGMLCLPAQSFGALTVASKDIIPADGTTSQDVTTGTGIKAGHIQNGAVTTSKIAALAVGTGNIADSAVANSKIADGAVTDAKITGPISANKITDGVFQKKHANVVVVAQSGGDFTDPISAVNSITSASATNRFLIKIMPGVYNIGSSPLIMKNYVDIDGSGENNTVIAGSAGGTNDFVTFWGVITFAAGVNSSAISNLTVQQNGGGSFYDYIGICCQYYSSPIIKNITTINYSNSYGIRVMNSSPVIDDVSIKMYGGGFGLVTDYGAAPVIKKLSINVAGDNNASSVGIYNNSGNYVVTHTDITVSGNTPNNIGITNLYSSLEVTNSTVMVSGTTSTAFDHVVDNSNEILKINNVIASGNTAVVNAYGAGFIYVGNSKLSGMINSPGTIKCVGSYDGNYDPLICQ